jgi:hypothetical protein
MITFSNEDVWLKKFYKSYFGDNVLDENRSALNVEEHRAKPGFPDKKYFSSGMDNQMQCENLQTDANQGNALTTENIFETLTKRGNLDIICIRAKSAHSKYNINLAYELSKQ